MGIFDKRERCEYCKEEMVSKYRNKKFCSAKCRVYWNRENKKKPQNAPILSQPQKIEGKKLRDILDSI